MGTWRLLLIITAIVVYTTSCQKDKSDEDGVTPPPPVVGAPLPTDSTPAGNTEVGNWKFISLSGKLGQTAEFSQLGGAAKVVSAGTFTSQNNSGTVTFDTSKITASQITMSINPTAKTYIYLNGVLVDSINTPLNEILPAQSAT